LIPGDGAAGDQGAQTWPVCLAMAATRRLRPVPSPTTSCRYGLRRTCRLVTGRSHRPRSTWPNQARLALLAVTHRYKRAHCLWLEQFPCRLCAPTADDLVAVQGAPIAAFCSLTASRTGLSPAAGEPVTHISIPAGVSRPRLEQGRCPAGRGGHGAPVPRRSRLQCRGGARPCRYLALDERLAPGAVSFDVDKPARAAEY
jgi:hypothetical protein